MTLITIVVAAKQIRQTIARTMVAPVLQSARVRWRDRPSEGHLIYENTTHYVFD